MPARSTPRPNSPGFVELLGPPFRNLRLLALDDSVKAQALAIDDDDDRLVGLSESGLRRLIGHEAKEQRRRFRDLVAGR